MKVTLLQQVLLDGCFGIVISEQEAVRKDDYTTTASFQAFDRESNEEVCSFRGTKVCGEALDVPMDAVITEERTMFYG